MPNPAAVTAGSSVVGAIGSLKNSGGSGSLKSTVNSDPWKGVQPYLTDIYKLAQQQYGQSPQAYPEQGFAPFDPLQIAGQEMAMKYATGSSALPPMQMPNMPTQVPSQNMGMAGMLGGGQMPFGQQPQQSMIPMPSLNLSPQQQNVGGYVPPPPPPAPPPGAAPPAGTQNMPAMPDLASILASIYQGLPF